MCLVMDLFIMDATGTEIKIDSLIKSRLSNCRATNKTTDINTLLLNFEVNVTKFIIPIV